MLNLMFMGFLTVLEAKKGNETNSEKDVGAGSSQEEKRGIERELQPSLGPSYLFQVRWTI